MLLLLALPPLPLPLLLLLLLVTAGVSGWWWLWWWLVFDVVVWLLLPSVRDYDQVKAAIAATLARFGRLDIVINGAAGE